MNRLLSAIIGGIIGYSVTKVGLELFEKIQEKKFERKLAEQKYWYDAGYRGGYDSAMAETGNQSKVK